MTTHIVWVGATSLPNNRSQGRFVHAAALDGPLHTFEYPCTETRRTDNNPQPPHTYAARLIRLGVLPQTVVSELSFGGAAPLLRFVRYLTTDEFEQLQPLIERNKTLTTEEKTK